MDNKIFVAMLQNISLEEKVSGVSSTLIPSTRQAKIIERGPQVVFSFHKSGQHKSEQNVSLLREELLRELDQVANLEDKKKKIDRHIESLHKYNEIKDTAQEILGKLAELKGATTKDMYELFDLKLTD